MGKEIKMDKFAFISSLVVVFILSMLLGLFLQWDKNKEKIGNLQSSHNNLADNLLKCDNFRTLYGEELTKLNKFFDGDIESCPDKEFKGQISIENVPSWINAGYYCDLKRITDQRPENVNYLSRWYSTFTCYKCNSP